MATRGLRFCLALVILTTALKKRHYGMQINYHLHLSLFENRQVGIWFVLMEMESFIFGIMKANMSKEYGELLDQSMNS